MPYLVRTTFEYDSGYFDNLVAPDGAARDLAPSGLKPGPRVLIVDDHPVHRRLAKAIFEAFACSTELVENGADALGACAGEAFDLVLLDRHMPVLGGDEAVRRLRGHQGPSTLAYVASCSSDPPSDLTAGYDAVAPKPLNVATARALLGQALARSASRAEQN